MARRSSTQIWSTDRVGWFDLTPLSHEQPGMSSRSCAAAQASRPLARCLQQRHEQLAKRPCDASCRRGAVRDILTGERFAAGTVGSWHSNWRPAQVVVLALDMPGSRGRGRWRQRRMTVTHQGNDGTSIADREKHGGAEFRHRGDLSDPFQAGRRHDDGQPGHPRRGGSQRLGPGRGHRDARRRARFRAGPADQEHMYGHGKIENLSALFETLLLLATCAWIIYEAIQRLFFEEVRRRSQHLGLHRHGRRHRRSTGRARGCSTGPPRSTTARRWKPTPCTSPPTSGPRRSSSSASSSCMALRATGHSRAGQGRRDCGA